LTYHWERLHTLKDRLGFPLSLINETSTPFRGKHWVLEQPYVKTRTVFCPPTRILQDTEKPPLRGPFIRLNR
jgi:hypothetical protein